MCRKSTFHTQERIFFLRQAFLARNSEREDFIINPPTFHHNKGTERTVVRKGSPPCAILRTYSIICDQNRLKRAVTEGGMELA